MTLAGTPTAAVLEQLGLPALEGFDPRDWAATRRALLLDLRNLGTLGLQQDSFPGLLWADAIYGNATLDAAAIGAIPPMYAAAALRRVVAQQTIAPLRAPDAAAVARGRELFANRIVGTIANRQILKEAPARYGPAKLSGPLLAPLDEALPATFPVRCADCHSATPGGRRCPFRKHRRRWAVAPTVTTRTPTSAGTVLPEDRGPRPGRPAFRLPFRYR